MTWCAEVKEKQNEILCIIHSVWNRGMDKLMLIFSIIDVTASITLRVMLAPGIFFTISVVAYTTLRVMLCLGIIPRTEISFLNQLYNKYLG